MGENLDSEVGVTTLQRLVEREKALLARSIHDELGGYLIASAMDVTLLRHRFSGHDSDTQTKFDRLARMLNGAIDMMRRVTEDLHPTLLDNVGLFAALRWHIRHTCPRSSITCTENLPDAEMHLPHAAAISLFRAGQEALIAAEDHPQATQVAFTMKVDVERLSMHVAADGALGPPSFGNRGQNALSFMRYRIEAMRGRSNVTYPGGGGMDVSASVSLAEALAFE